VPGHRHRWIDALARHVFQRFGSSLHHGDRDKLAELIRAGLDGIEVIHPSHSPERVKYYRGIAAEYFLLEGGGSDFHGGKRNDEAALGAFTIDVDQIEAMKRRLFIK